MKTPAQIRAEVAKHKVTPELREILKTVQSLTLSFPDRFTSNCIANVTSGTILEGTSLDRDQWFAIRHAVIRFVVDLKRKTGWEEIFFCAPDFDDRIADQRGWYTTEKVHELTRAVLGEETDPVVRAEFALNNFVNPMHVIGEFSVEYWE